MRLSWLIGVPSVVVDAGVQRDDGSRAIAVHRTAVMVWERLGCVAPMLAEGVAWRVRRTFCGDRELYAQVMPTVVAGDVPTFLNLPQYLTEDCLIRARSIGAARPGHRRPRIVYKQEWLCCGFASSDRRAGTWQCCYCASVAAGSASGGTTC